MYPFDLVFRKVTGFYNYICQYVDRPEVIFALTMIALLVSLGLIRLRR